MPAGRHRRTTHTRVRLQRWGALTAPILAAATVVPAASAIEPRPATPQAGTAPDRASSPAIRAYTRAVSRGLDRPEPPAPSLADVGRISEPAVEEPTPPPPAELSARWVSVALNVRTAPREDSRLLTVLEPGSKVQVTGVDRGSWAEVVRDDRLAWVHKEYLLRSKPEPTGSSAPVRFAPCPDGSAVESGLTSNAVKVYRAVCAAFPSVSSWGGRTGSGGNHSAGLAVDIMVTGSTGDTIADYVRANASELGVSEVIWAQRIWTVQRAGEGWRYMEDRGSSTANHYDHVHVSVY